MTLLLLLLIKYSITTNRAAQVASFEAPVSVSVYSIFIDPYLDKQLVLLLGL